MSGVDQRGIWKRQQLGAQRIVKQPAQIRGRPPQSHAQVGPSYIADEQCVAGQNGIGSDISMRQIIDKNGDGLWSMPRRLQDLQTYLTELDKRSVTNRREFVGSLSFSAQVDGCSGAIA